MNNLCEFRMKNHPSQTSTLIFFSLRLILFISIMPSLNCHSQKPQDMHQEHVTQVSKTLSLNEFEKIKRFVLKNGDRSTFRNIDNNNPHYKFDKFSIYFGADVGQLNINNDPKISDFNELTIVDWHGNTTYLQLVVVREGDLEINKARLLPGMETGQVYLIDNYHVGEDRLLKLLPKYLEQINAVIDNFQDQ